MFFKTTRKNYLYYQLSKTKKHLEESWCLYSILFVLYAVIGKVGTKLLADNFSYLASALLLLFAIFLFREAYSLGFINT